MARINLIGLLRIGTYKIYFKYLFEYSIAKSIKLINTLKIYSEYFSNILKNIKKYIKLLKGTF